MVFVNLRAIVVVVRLCVSVVKTAAAVEVFAAGHHVDRLRLPRRTCSIEAPAGNPVYFLC